VATAIDKANLGSVVHKPIETLSKGFKRRVGLAQAILHDPPILVMDEGWQIEEVFVEAGQLDEVFRRITTRPASLPGGAAS